MTWSDIGFGIKDALNQSKIHMYQRCPKQFEYAHVKGLRMPPNLKLTVGHAVHKGVEVNYRQKLKTKRDCKKDVVLDATRDGFRSAIKTDGIKATKFEIGKSQDEAIIMAGMHYDSSAPSFQPIILPETQFSIRMPNSHRKLYGTIDLMAEYHRRSDAIVVSDTKTTRRAYDRKRVDVDIQLTAYAYAAIHCIKQVPKLVIFDTIILKGNAAISDHLISTRNKADIERFVQTFKAVERGIDAGAFPPTDNEQTCSWCGFNSLCWKGRPWTKP